MIRTELVFSLDGGDKRLLYLQGLIPLTKIPKNNYRHSNGWKYSQIDKEHLTQEQFLPTNSIGNVFWLMMFCG